MCHKVEICVFVEGGGHRWHRPLLKKANMGDFKRISELIDTYYPEISERLRNGERNGK